MPRNTESMHATATVEPTEEATMSPAGLVFDFPAGVPGFTDVQAFQLLPLGPEFGPYLALKAAGRNRGPFCSQTRCRERYQDYTPAHQKKIEG